MCLHLQKPSIVGRSKAPECWAGSYAQGEVLAEQHPLSGCSHQFGVFPTLLCTDIFAGLGGGVPLVLLELLVLSAGAAPAPNPVPFRRCSHCNHGQRLQFCRRRPAAFSLKEKAIYSLWFSRVLN